MIRVEKKWTCDACGAALAAPQVTESWKDEWSDAPVTVRPAITFHGETAVIFDCCQGCLDKMLAFLDPKGERRAALKKNNGGREVTFNVCEKRGRR